VKASTDTVDFAGWVAKVAAIKNNSS